MLKDIDKYETSSHFSYDENRKPHKKQSPRSDIMIFASVFIIGVLIILGFAKILSPNVDVSISKEGEMLSSEEENLNRVVDDRLKRLKLEDEGKQVGDEEMFSPDLDEKVVLPDVNHSKEQVQNTKEENQVEATEEKKKEEKISQPEQTTVQKNAPQPETVNAKVVVGYYASEKQAEVAKSIMMDAGLDVTPVVKNLGGYYTLQVGAYTNRERAQQAANNLLKNNFPARVIVE